LSPLNSTVKERVFKTLWSMKNDGYCETTIYATSRRLRMIARHLDTDIDNPEKVKEYIAEKTATNGYKENLADTYDRYVHYNGLNWQRPYYVRESQTPYAPTEEEISVLINSSPPKYALILSILRDTGMRPIELERLRLKWIDFERSSINVQTAKGGQGRTLQLKPQTVAMLKEYVGKHRLNLNDRLFATVACMRRRFSTLKHTAATKLQRPELLRINLYSFRHFFGTMTYHKTKDILYTQRQMGHRNIKNTLVYAHLIQFSSEEFISKVADTVEEACNLIEAGFEYVTDVDSVKIFRKRK
jgi:integrase